MIKPKFQADCLDCSDSEYKIDNRPLDKYTENFQSKNESTLDNLLLPLLPLRDIVVFPHMVAPFLWDGQNRSMPLPSHEQGQEGFFLPPRKKPELTTPHEKDISTIGTIGTVLQLLGFRTVR